MAHYGFVLACNKYETLSFKVCVDFGWREKIKNPNAPVTDDMKVQKTIILKENKLREELFSYIRASLMNDREKQKAEGGTTQLGGDEFNEFVIRTPEGEEKKLSREELEDQSHLLVSSPVDPSFELLVVATSIQLLESMKPIKFKIPLEYDQKVIKEFQEGSSEIGYHEYNCCLYRLIQRRILDRNITMLQILMRVLTRIR